MACDDSILSGWKEIADYCGVSVRTAQRYAEKAFLPIIIEPVGGISIFIRSRPRARKADIQSWMLGQNMKIDEDENKGLLRR
jgi:hypothetical protein